jgi:hypothetical protein
MRALALAAAAALAWQPAALDDLIGRAGRYVVEYRDALALIVLEEHYVQSVVQPGFSGVRHALRQRRELRSDVLLVRAERGQAWRTFRDTYTADGEIVRDRTDRLVRLFLDAPRTAVEQARAIPAESARFNIGYVDRDINTPLLALTVLDPANQSRFRFERRRDEPAAARGPGRTVLHFREVGRPTLINTAHGTDLPVEGRFWVDPDTGRVERSELIAEDRQVHATIGMRYVEDEALRMWLPFEMQETYVARGAVVTIEGRATYGNARRFQVKVIETIRPPG